MISKGQQSTNEVARTLYMGVGAVKVLAVNPNKATLEKIYVRTMDKDPVYLGEWGKSEECSYIFCDTNRCSKK